MTDPRKPTLRLTNALLALAVIVLLGLKFRLLWTLNINWDEFAYLARIYEAQRGDLHRAFQTFYVHLFQWVTAVPGNEVDQILAGRLFAYALEIGAAACLFLVARRLAGPTGAWFALISSLSFSFTLRHGESFRADPIISFLFLLTVALLVLRGRSRVAITAAAAAFASAVLVSIKSVLFAPTIAGLLACGLLSAQTRRHALLNASIFFGLSVVFYFGLYLLHADVMRQPPTVSTAHKVVEIGERMWLAPNVKTILTTLSVDWLFWLALAVGSAIALHRVVFGRPERRHDALVVAAMLLPLGSLFFYRNAFAYFYVCLVPAASVACALAARSAEERFRHKPQAVATVVIFVSALFVYGGATFYVENRADAVAPQRAVVEVVHEIFPDPVPYLDRCGMISSFPRVGPFMSTLVLSDYRRRQTPVMANVVEHGNPAFLLANAQGFNLSVAWEDLSDLPHRLLREDFEYLKSVYIHHWGPVWVPGVNIDSGAAGARNVDIAVSGPYTVESTGPIFMEGDRLEPGHVVQLTVGQHALLIPESSMPVTLRYGKRLPVPDIAPPTEPIFTGLGFHGTRL